MTNYLNNKTTRLMFSYMEIYVYSFLIIGHVFTFRSLLIICTCANINSTILQRIPSHFRGHLAIQAKTYTGLCWLEISHY